MIFGNKYDLRVVEEMEFVDLYEVSIEEFINTYDDKIVLDLTDKVVVALESSWNTKTFPVNVLAVFIPEETKYSYKAQLIYAGHISFIKLEYEDGKIKYLIKDDECLPVTFEELVKYDSSIIYECVENGFEVKDIVEQIKMAICINYDFNYILEKENLIILEGL